MSGKAGYTLAGLRATYAAAQLGRWTEVTGQRNRMAGQRRNRQRQPYFPPRARPGGRGRGQTRRQPRTQTGVRQKQKLHQSATTSGDGSFSVMATKCSLFTAKACLNLTTCKMTYLYNYHSRLTATSGTQAVSTP